ncbi:MAG TPA: S41 family peptidase [Longimicrobium sp.]|jgi:hypothetical protein
MYLLLHCLLTFSPTVPPPMEHAPSQDTTVDSAVRRRVVEAAAARFSEGYVFPQAGERARARLRARLAQGAYDRFVHGDSLAAALTADLQAATGDRHAGVFFNPVARPATEWERPTAEALEQVRRGQAFSNFAFKKVERLDGNVGYVRVDLFLPPAVAGETLASAMTFLANTDALIIDLRNNRGGEPAAVALMASYLVGPEPVQLSGLVTRNGKEVQSWTSPFVPGARFAGRDVFVLTSGRTASAAEALAYDLQALGRARVVGEKTAGAANPGGTVRIDERFVVFVPTERALSPITRSNWEGLGVTPDIPVPAEAAQQTAYVAALRAALQRDPSGDYSGLIRGALEAAERAVPAVR